MKKILLIDNHDSFTYILKSYLERIPYVSSVDVIFTEEALSLNTGIYHAMVISPGPGTPEDWHLQEIIANTYGKIPILGVCLGLQALIVFEGGKLIQLPGPQHGVQATIQIMQSYPFFNENWKTLQVGLYHSWGVALPDIPSTYVATSFLQESFVIQSMVHTTLPIAAVQFHPESHLTREGLTILRNWFNSMILS